MSLLTLQQVHHSAQGIRTPECSKMLPLLPGVHGLGRCHRNTQQSGERGYWPKMPSHKRANDPTTGSRNQKAPATTLASLHCVSWRCYLLYQLNLPQLSFAMAWYRSPPSRYSMTNRVQSGCKHAPINCTMLRSWQLLRMAISCLKTSALTVALLAAQLLLLLLLELALRSRS